MQGGAQGRVRSWVDWPEAALLLLNMRGNRWCGNIGRAHKSNGVFYVVDLQARRPVVLLAWLGDRAGRVSCPPSCSAIRRRQAHRQHALG